ncbi:helix-turn-helix transcriptional regulator [Chitinophaga defluvii]|uniref:Helix-turn-helix transcriptional regulator n=1 Tax=Chitinophaga defluvii TaxID=3163343 RepID=A0ABV2T3N0_9BACT
MSKPSASPQAQAESYALYGLSYADDHVADTFDIRIVADMLDISYSHFYHTFSAVMNEPYWHYVKRHRIELAAGMLRHSGYSIAEIGELSGYMTLAAFSKAFKQHFKYSPKDFRKIQILPNEKRTLHITETITASFGNNMLANLFHYDRTERISISESTLYYTLLSHGDDPITEMVLKMNNHENRFRKIIEIFDIPQALVITGTLDAVPVTNYEKLSIFAGILLPNHQLAAHKQLRDNYPYLLQKRIQGGSFLKLRLPLSFAAAGIPMYEFIDRSCREGIFKMRDNQFFISLTGPNSCEIFIPLLKQRVI